MKSHFTLHHNAMWVIPSLYKALEQTFTVLLILAAKGPVQTFLSDLVEFPLVIFTETSNSALDIPSYLPPPQPHYGCEYDYHLPHALPSAIPLPNVCTITKA